MFYQLSLEGFVPSEHPLRRIRPFIDDQAIRKACRPLYSDIGRPSIPPEQLFLALIGRYLLGIPSERKLVMELQCNMALRWFVGLNLDQDAWNASTFSQNRRRRFDASGVLEKLFDETVKRAMTEGLVSRHVSAPTERWCAIASRDRRSFGCLAPVGQESPGCGAIAAFVGSLLTVHGSQGASSPPVAWPRPDDSFPEPLPLPPPVPPAMPGWRASGA